MKNISRILVITLIVSMFLSFSGFAVNHLEQDIIDTVVKEKIWTFGEFAPEEEITAGRFVSMLEKALNIENGEDYVSDYSESKILTRLDVAVAADKIALEKANEYYNRTYVREIYTDTDDLTDEQFQSVYNAVVYGTVKALAGKKFAPYQNADNITAAKAVLTLRSMSKKGPEYTVRDLKKGESAKNFDVHQKGVLYTNCGIAGFGMVVRFDGAPGEIYVARTTKKPVVEDQWGNPAAPVTLARVIDPDGNIVARVNLDYVDSGKMEKVINVSEGKAGIYQINFSNGRSGDICEIGINNPVSWGVRGEHILGYTETTPKTGYIYIPNTYKHLSLAIGEYGGKLTLSSLDGKQKFETVEDVRATTFEAIETKELVPDSVYKITVDDDYRDSVEIHGATRTICPTAQMAKDLKGGLVEVKDEYGSFTLPGPLQARARAKMVDIYKKANGTFDVDTTLPYETLPDNLDNPIAESQLFSTYYGSIPALNCNIEGQCLDPSNPWFGMYVGPNVISGKKPYPENSYLNGFYDEGILGSTASQLTGALAINSELNGFYDDPALRDRVALSQLASVVYMSEDNNLMDMRTPENNAGYFNIMNSNFQFPDWAHGYYSVRRMLDDETREICDTALKIIADKQLAMRGHGPTNQSMMHFACTMTMYEMTGDENYHTFFKRMVDAYCYPNARPAYSGQAEAGYFIESGGCDGIGYEYHNHDYYARALMVYFNLPEEKQDPETKAKLVKSSQRNLDFISKFMVSDTDGLQNINATNFASRTRTGLGAQSAYTANNFLINHMSTASALWHNVEKPNMVTQASYTNSDEYAYKHLNKMYEKYDKYYGLDSGRQVKTSLMYEEMHKEHAPTEELPYQYEGDYKVWDQPGLVALKHKGIYMVSFYDNTLPRTTNVFSPKSWMGGGPTFSWVKGMGYTTSSDKPVNYGKLPGSMLQLSNVVNYKPYWTTEEMIHAGIVGTDANGELFASGKERADLEWIEKDKTFKISGITPIDKKEVSWIYNLTEEGVEITAGIDSISGKEEYWMQIPIVDESNLNSEYSLAYEPGKIVLEYRGKTTTFTWDASFESTLFDHDPEANVRTQILKIKLSPANLNATVKMVVK